MVPVTNIRYVCTVVTILKIFVESGIFWVGVISSPESPPRPLNVAFFKGYVGAVGAGQLQGGECYNLLMGVMNFGLGGLDNKGR